MKSRHVKLTHNAQAAEVAGKAREVPSGKFHAAGLLGDASECLRRVEGRDNTPSPDLRQCAAPCRSLSSRSWRERAGLFAAARKGRSWRAGFRGAERRAVRRRRMV
jgi:hypothetical protein